MADKPNTKDDVELEADDVVDDGDDDADGDDAEKKVTPRPKTSSTPRRPGARVYQSRYRRSSHFRPRRKVCAFCADKVKAIDWKEVNTLRRFVGDDGSIRARRKTGTCARHQRRLAVAIKRARHLALLHYTGEHVRLSSRN